MKKKSNEEGNKIGLGKRIAAVAASLLLLFSRGDAHTTTSYLLNSDMPAVEENMTTKNKDNYFKIANNYSGFRETAEEIISLEDMLQTPVGGGICDTMVPQGIAMVDDVILITAYDGIDGYKSELKMHSYKKEYRDKLTKEASHEVHNSVIVAIDKNTKNIITTIELPDQNHVGGIAVDDQNAYIAKSQDEQISVISLDKIREALAIGAKQGVKSYKTDYDAQLDCKCNASIVSIRETDDGQKQLVIGTWNPFPINSVIRLFDFGPNNDLVLRQTFTTRPSVNGATFVRRGNEEYFLAACSQGRSLNSKLFVYEVDNKDDGKIGLKERSHVDLPPMIEEMVEYEAEDGKRTLLIASEALSKRYEIGKSHIISNGIIVANLDSLLDRTEKPKKAEKQDIYFIEDAIVEEDDKEKDKEDKERE